MNGVTTRVDTSLGVLGAVISLYQRSGYRHVRNTGMFSVLLCLLPWRKKAVK